nr:MFS transporter [Chitinimonas koreensis]
MQALANWARGRFHYGWIAIAVTFLVMLVTAGTRATPSVMMVPLEQELGWSRATISLALSINLALFGLMGPFAAAAMLRFGLRRTVLTALTVLAGAVALSSRMQSTWQLQLIWGLVVGCATGATAMTLGASVVNRWFVERRGLAMGLLTASSATGQLVFLPLLAAITEQQGWRPVVLLVAAAAAVVIPLVAWLLPERPGAVGLRAYGEADDAPPPRRRPAIRSPSPSQRWRALPSRATSGCCSSASSSAAPAPTATSAPTSSPCAATTASRRCAAPASWPRWACSTWPAPRCRAGCRTATTHACCCSGTTACADWR